MRNLTLAAATAICVSPAAYAQDVCFQMDAISDSMDRNDFSLTFEGFSGDEVLLVFTKEDGEWVAVIKTADGRGCGYGAGDGFNVTIGSLM